MEYLDRNMPCVSAKGDRMRCKKVFNLDVDGYVDVQQVERCVEEEYFSGYCLKHAREYINEQAPDEKFP